MASFVNSPLLFTQLGADFLKGRDAGDMSRYFSEVCATFCLFNVKRQTYTFCIIFLIEENKLNNGLLFFFSSHILAISFLQKISNIILVPTTFFLLESIFW